jgi:23S rRNA (pseudouridine1915-N3)-methyltransferase
LRLVLASVSARREKGKSEAAELLVHDFATRANRYSPTETAVYLTESALLEALDRDPSRQRPTLILFDSRGDLLTSEQFAAHIGTLRDNGAQRLILAIGPADGWSDTARGRAHKILSFGRMTMPHELARAVLAEQTYRALTILAGHPYHSGH